MKKRLRHITPVLFLGFLLLPVFCMLLLQGAQWYLKSTSWERMEHHQIVSLSLPAGQAVWHKEGKELSIDGKLFDIQQYSTEDGVLHVTGYFDDEELNIARLLSVFAPGQQNGTLLHFFLVLQCFLTPLVFIRYAPVYRQSKMLLSVFPCYLPFPPGEPESLPPRC